MLLPYFDGSHPVTVVTQIGIVAAIAVVIFLLTLSESKKILHALTNAAVMLCAGTALLFPLNIITAWSDGTREANNFAYSIEYTYGAHLDDRSAYLLLHGKSVDVTVGSTKIQTVKLKGSASEGYTLLSVKTGKPIPQVDGAK